MRPIINKIFFNRFFATLFIKSVLRLHSLCYHIAAKYAIILNNGRHPKHNILQYKQWFSSNIKDGWVVLDIGSNTGLLPLALAQKADYVYGIEIDKNMTNIAKTRNARDNIEYICADATTYDYDLSRQVNCVVLSNILEHIDSRIDFLKNIINKIKWADENHKNFLLRVPMIDREWIVLYKKGLNLEYRLDKTHYIEYTLKTLKQELNQAGLKINKTRICFGEICAVCEAI
jgi:SAM-dependent methyltransferase